MTILVPALLGLLLLLLLFCVVMLIRNQLVANTRFWLLDHDFEAYTRLPSYDAMMRDFSCWTRSHWIKRIGGLS